MNLNFNKPLVDLDGKKAGELSLGKILASHLAVSNEGDPIKFMEWARTLHFDRSLEIDKSDSNTLKAFIEKYKGFNNLIKDQLLEVFYLCEVNQNKEPKKLEKV